MAQPVEATIRSFRIQQLAATQELLNPVILALAVSDTDSANAGLGSVLEFVTGPFAGAASDRYTRKKILVASLFGLAFARGGDWLRKVAGIQTTLLTAIGQGCLGSILITSKASLADLCDDTLGVSQSSIQLASMGAIGALLNPIFQGLVRRSISGESSPQFISALVALACACSVLVQGDSPEAQVDPYSEDSIIAYSPLSFARLASSSPEAPKAMAASFFAQIAGGVAVRELLEQTVSSTSPSASVRLRILLAISLASIAGTALSGKIQQTLGLYDQASIASVAHVATATALVFKRPYLAALFLLLGQRGSDVTDLYLLDNRADGGGRGETVASIANWHAVAATVGPVVLGYVHSRTGAEGLCVALLVSAIASEYLRRKIRTKQMSID